MPPCFLFDMRKRHGWMFLVSSTLGACKESFEIPVVIQYSRPLHNF
jgi:hypothetical protein